MVFNMKRKEIILGVIGIIVIIVVAFFLANIIHDYNIKLTDKENGQAENTKEESIKEKYKEVP